MQFLKQRAASVLAVLAVGSISFAATATIVAASSDATAAGQPGVLIEKSPTSSPAPVRELAIGEVVAIHDPADIVFPIDSYRPVAEQQNVLLRAEQLSVESCVSSFGLSFDYPIAAVPAENHDYDRLFGVIELSVASSSGYHLPGEVLDASGQSPKTDAPQRQTISSERATSVAIGEVDEVGGRVVPDGGCVGQARSQVGDDGRLQELYEGAVNYGLDQSDRDPRVLKGFQAWSSCMTSRGFDYERPDDAINDAQWATATATDDEIAVAVADVECKQASNLTGLRVAVATAWQQQFISKHSSELKAAQNSIKEHLIKAKALLKAEG